MNTQQFLSWMRNPGQTAREDGAQLDALLDTFPYFQSAHLLYIKNLHNQGSFLYNNQLKTAAAYAANRKVLYELITRKEVVQPAPELHEQSSTATELVVPEQKVKEVDVVPEIPMPPQVPQKRFVKNPDEWEAGMLRQLQLLHHWSTSPKPETAIQKTEESIPVSDQVAIPPQEELSETVLEVPAAKDEINTLLYVLVEPGDPEDISEDISEEIVDAPQSKDEADSTEWIINPQQQEAHVAEAETEPHSTVVIPTDPVQQDILLEAIHSTFSLEVDDQIPTAEELQPLKQEQVPVAQEETVKPTEEVVVTGLELSFSQWINQLNPTPEPEPSKPKPSEDSLIDQFIKEEPRIKVKKSGFFNPVNMAKKSVQESDEFITETLARIYAKQGNYPKAIRAYQKLSLKFPEKTTYFAALIEELKRTPDKPSQK